MEFNSPYRFLIAIKAIRQQLLHVINFNGHDIMGKFNKLTRVIKLVNEHSIIYTELSETFLSSKNHRINYRKGVYWAFIGISMLSPI